VTPEPACFGHRDTFCRRLAGIANARLFDKLVVEHILKLMFNQSSGLDLTFQALADPTRRAIIERLSRGPASVKDIARPLPMSLPAVVQHLRLLEASGLVRSEKIGRVRTCQIAPKGLSLAERWISERRSLWERRLDRLGGLLAAERDDHAQK
jgi:DNA-binding transcriptional ArsR family regulator